MNLKAPLSIDDALARMGGDVPMESEETTQEDHPQADAVEDVVDASTDELEGEEQEPNIEPVQEGDDADEEVGTDETDVVEQDEGGEVEEEVEATAEGDETENDDDDQEVQEKSFEYNPDLELEVPGIGKTTLGELRQGNLLEGDYTRGKQQLAEEKKAFYAERDADRQSLENERQTLSQKVEALDATLDVMKAQFKAEEPSIEELEKLVEEDPVEFQRQMLRTRKMEAKLAEIESQVQDARSEHDRQTKSVEDKKKADWESFVSEQRTKLLEAKPEWANNDTFDNDVRAMIKAVDPFGITQEEVRNTVDVRQLQFLDAFVKQQAEIDRLKNEGKKERAKVAKVEKAKPALKKKIVSSKQRIKPTSSTPAKPEGKAAY